MRTSAQPKKPTNLSLDKNLLIEAKALGINLSRAAESGVRLAVASAKSKRWQRENARALESSCKWIEENGLPLDRYRKF